MNWENCSEVPRLKKGDVQVWKVSVNPVPPGHPALGILNHEETERAKRFYFDKDRDLFTGSRIVLRYLLSRITHEHPAGLRFAFGEHGKPQLADHGDIHFNLSHSRYVSVLAVSRTGPVGIDVEATDRQIDIRALSRNFFSLDEHQHLEQQDGDEQYCFFDIWTRKEAFIKALGTGISEGLQTFSVPTVAEASGAPVVHHHGRSKGLALWSLPPINGFRGAVCTSPASCEHLYFYETRLEDILSREHFD